MRGAPRAGIILVMARISTDEVTRVAGLARIALTPEEITRIAGELDVITEAVAKVSEVATPDVPATSHPIPLSNVWREDVVGHKKTECSWFRRFWRRTDESVAEEVRLRAC